MTIFHITATNRRMKVSVKCIKTPLRMPLPDCPNSVHTSLKNTNDPITFDTAANSDIANHTKTHGLAV